MTDPTDALRDAELGAHKCCANCKHWDWYPDAPHLGLCLNHPKVGKAETVGGRSAPVGGRGVASAAFATTDLTVCSKWEQKD